MYLLTQRESTCSGAFPKGQLIWNQDKVNFGETLLPLQEVAWGNFYFLCAKQLKADLSSLTSLTRVVHFRGASLFMYFSFQGASGAHSAGWLSMKRQALQTYVHVSTMLLWTTDARRAEGGGCNLLSLGLHGDCLHRASPDYHVPDT